jgi:hypothetical protein
MKRQPVHSSAIRSVGYDTGKQVLEVEFVETGHVYRYTGVPPRVYKALMKAASIGKYYNQYVKDRFSYEMVY